MRLINRAASHQTKENSLLRVHSSPPLEFFLILGRSARSIFDLWVFAGQRCRASVRLEELGGGFIATHFHHSKLLPLPLYTQISWLVIVMGICESRLHTV